MPGSPQPADDALLFFRDVVEPTVAEFMADRADKRRGCLACLALTSMTEHFFYARVGSSKKACGAFKSSVRGENWAVGAIADVANATKHVLRHEKKWGYDDVSTHRLNVFGIMRAGWPLGGREVLVGPDRAWRLPELIECAMNFWRDKLGLSAPDR